MAANSSIDLVSLDFANLKNSFKNYLRTQTQFKDYDFEGSNLSVLMDLLAYNSFKNAFYTNMALSEGFLDSAQLRNSLYSHAKELNYLPRSRRSAKARVRVTFEATGDSQPYVIPKGSQFSSLVKAEAFTFSVPETLVVASANTTFQFETDIYEGVHTKDMYVFKEDTENQRFRITNKNIDTRSLSVTVFEDGSEVGDVYKMSTTLLDLNYKSKVYFLQTGETGYYEIYFGDNVLGKQPKASAIIVLDYRISRGSEGNGAKSFSIDFDPTGLTELTLGQSPVITVLETAKNGDEEESNESIRYYAPRHYQTQERAVTHDDYEIALRAAFPEIRAISVYGGEDVDPPKYGKVYISIDLQDIDGVPQSKRDEYYDFIKKRNVVPVEPVFIEPDETYFELNAKVRYNVNQTTKSSSRIKTLVTNAIINYADSELDDFNVTMRHSQLEAIINAADASIVSSIADARLYKKFTPIANNPQNFDFKFNVALSKLQSYSSPDYADFHSVVESSLFKFDGITVRVMDDGAGKLNIIDINGNKIIEVGSVDYEKGYVKLNAFDVDGFEGAYMYMYVVPLDKDIKISQNSIFLLEPSAIDLNVEALSI